MTQQVGKSTARRQFGRSRKPRVTLDSLSLSSLTRGYNLSPLRRFQNQAIPNPESDPGEALL